MKTVYLCGAINGCNDSECKDWREHATRLLTGKFAILDPMRRDYRGIEDESVNAIVHGDYDDINNSDVLLVAADRPSWGTAMEVHYAFEHAKHVVVVCGNERISPWLRYHCHKLTPTLQQAIEYIIDTFGGAA